MLSLRSSFVLLLALAFHFVIGDMYPSALSHEQEPTIIRSRVDQRNTKGQELSDSKAARNLPPLPQPHETIGYYFDKYADLLDGDTSNNPQMSEATQSEITQRNLVRTSDQLTSVWSDSKENYNISVSKCIHFSDIIGTWTTEDGTNKVNATMEDINNDLQKNISSMSDLSTRLRTRLLANVELAAFEAESLLNATVCNYSTPVDPQPLPSAPAATADTTDLIAHDELRKLLNSDTAHALDTKFMAMDGYWTSNIMSMGAGAAVAGALYKGFYNHNASSTNVAIVCFTAGGLIFARGIIERLYMNGMLRYVEVSVISAFTSWFRRAVQLALNLQREYVRRVGADQQESGCLEEIVIENSGDSLPSYSDPRTGVIELVPMGVCF